MDTKQAAEVLRVMMLDSANYREDSQAAEMGAQAREAWAWVERMGAIIDPPQNGGDLWSVAWHRKYSVYYGPTPLVAVLDAMEKEGKGNG